MSERGILIPRLVAKTLTPCVGNPPGASATGRFRAGFQS